VFNIDYIPSGVFNIDYVPSGVFNIDYVPSGVFNIDYVLRFFFIDRISSGPSWQSPKE
jgi:hypothetical protein